MNCESVCDTFPWPQSEESREANEGGEGKKRTSPTSRPSRDAVATIDAVAAAQEESREANEGGEGKKKTSPTSPPTRDTPAKIDAVAVAVLAAYGFCAKKNLLAQLLALNQEVATNIEKGSPVTAPGVPKN